MGVAQKTVAWSPQINCWSCNTAFSIESELHQRRLSDGNAFYCPNGHANYYTDSVDKKRIKELERQVASERQRADTAQRNREWAESRAKGANIAAGKAKAEKRRILERVHAGVCPHCNRTFRQLAAHMKTQHPGC